MCQCKHRCFELQEVLTDAAQVFLPDNTRIRTNRITSIYVAPSDPTGSLDYYTPLGREIAPWDVLNSSYLNVVNQNGTKLAQIPIAALIRTTESPEPLRVDWLQVDPTQTFIQVGTSAAGYSATDAIVIMFGLACDECGITPNDGGRASRTSADVIV